MPRTRGRCPTKSRPGKLTGRASENKISVSSLIGRLPEAPRTRHLTAGPPSGGCPDLGPSRSLAGPTAGQRGGNQLAIALKPLGDRLVIEPSEDDTDQSPGGIYIPDTAKEKPQKGKVVAVGPGRVTDDAVTIKIAVKVGNTVIYSKYAGTEYTENGTEYLIIRDSDLLATVG